MRLLGSLVDNSGFLLMLFLVLFSILSVILNYLSVFKVSADIVEVCLFVRFGFVCLFLQVF
jgi:hypothetical protein